LFPDSVVDIYLRNKIWKQSQCFINYRLSTLSQRLSRMSVAEVCWSRELEWTKSRAKTSLLEESKATVIAREENNFRRRICEALEILCKFLVLNWDCGFELLVLQYTGMFWHMPPPRVMWQMDPRCIHLRRTLWQC